jgi:hypothetical protein
VSDPKPTSSRAGPQTSRPLLPEGYGIPQSDEGLLPWSYARERLEQAQNYWLCTASPNARPHAAPLWGVWLDDRLFFDGHPATRWGRNILANPSVAVHLESGNEVVIVEGIVEDIATPDRALATRVADAYEAKYGYRLPDHGFFVFTPRVAYGWTQFPKDATRWRFD